MGEEYDRAEPTAPITVFGVQFKQKLAHIVSKPRSHAALGRLRSIALVEGISYLLLLFIAMPLKYLAGFEAAVSVVGWAHGILFMLYVISVVETSYARKWPFRRILWAMIASVIPFATFVLEKQLRREQQAVAVAVA